MRTHTLLSLALLGLLAWASCIQADDVPAVDDNATDAETPVEIEETEEETEEESEKTPKKEKTTEIEEENNVMVLHNVNFARALSENPFVLVEFCKYSPLIILWSKSRASSFMKLRNLNQRKQLCAHLVPLERRILTKDRTVTTYVKCCVTHTCAVLKKTRMTSCNPVM